MKNILETLALLLLLTPFALTQDEGDETEAAAPEAQAPTHPYEVEADRVPSFQTGGSALITNVTIHSAVGPAEIGDVLVRDGDIVAIGRGLQAPAGVMAIDGSGRHLAPGVIDTHSHMAIERGINEGTLSITAECNISDSIDSEDLGIYRALAGGVTTIQCLHGSANTIGGRSEVLKLRWGGHTADELRFPGAPQGIKFALGENVKRAGSGGRGGQRRFPGTRMGVEGVFDRAFMRTREYQDEWAGFAEARARGEDPAPPRRDIRLDVLAGILTGDVIVHSHCYRADEILMLLRVADRYGFRIATLQHVLEGYKVAPEIAAHGAGTSTFSDWWAYKIEAYDAIPQNAALLDEAGVVSTINSDSGELVRHLYLEAAKSRKYAGLDPVRTLALATLNGAKQLRIEDRVGSIEVGKDADLVLLDGDPLSIFSKVLWTMVDGEVEFTRRDAFGFDGTVQRVDPIEESIVIEASYDPDGGRTIAITGGTIHPVTGREIENGTIVVQGDRIVDIGRRVAIPVGAEVIDATGRHVWPGMIALNTPLGLREIGSIRETNDDGEGGGNQPDLRVSAALHPDSAHIPVTRANGVTRAQTAPQGGGPLMGQSAVIKTTGDTWEELLHVDRDMLHIAFPSTSNRAEKKDEPESLKEVKELLAESREYARLLQDSARTGSPMPPYDPRLEALIPYARGEKPVALHVGNAQTILFAIEFAQEEELDAVLFGCKEGWKVVDAIAESGLPVVVGPVLTVPSTFDPYDACYANPAVLHRAGVPIAIMSDDSGNPRNASFHAGMAVAFGLPREEAVRSLTYYAAEILGLEDELGSLQVGKLADIVITDGELLEATTQVTDMLIDGVPQSLDNKHSELYERYRERLHTVQGTGNK